MLATVLPVPVAATAAQLSGSPVAEPDAPAVPAERARAVGSAIGFDTWPRPEALFLAPPVSRELLALPVEIGQAVRACTTVHFAAEPWGRCDWSWHAEDDPESWLDLSMTLAPSARAAQQVLLNAVSDNMLPVEAAAATLTNAGRPAGLGDVAFVVSARAGGDQRIDFTRSNLAVRIRARGAMAERALDIARRIDAQVLDQRPLSAEELIARRPRLTLDADPDGGVLAYRLSLPGTPPVVALRASAAGRPLAAAGGRVLLGRSEGAPSSVAIVAITADLLAAEASVTLTAKQ
jgi:hypothetical protein